MLFRSATFLLNEKRQIISDVEKRCGVSVVLVPNPHLDTPRYDIQRLRDDEARQPGSVETSYKLVTEPQPAPLPGVERTREPAEEPLVKGLTPATPAPVPKVDKASIHEPGLFVRMWRALFGSGEKQPVRSSPPPRPQQARREEFSRRDRNQPRERSRDRGERNRDRDRHAQGEIGRAHV